MRTLLLGATLVAAATAAVAYFADAPETTWQRLERTGTVRVGFAPEAPYAYRTADGEVTGIDPELARAVFDRLGGYRIQWVQTEFRSLIPELAAGRFDVIASGMVVTPERAREIAFSAPTFAVLPALLVRTADTARYGELDGLRRDGAANVAVLESAIEGPLLLRAGFGAERLLTVPDAVTGVEAVRTGRAAALALTAPAVQHLAGASGGTLWMVRIGTNEPALWESSVSRGALGFRQDDAKLRAAVDDVLRDYVGSAEHRALAARFGFGPEDLPSP